MPRVKGGIVTRKRRKKVMKLAKGYRGAKHMQFKAASTQLFVSYKYAFRDQLAGVDMNRKMLADIAYNDSKTFAQLAETAKKALN